MSIQLSPHQSKAKTKYMEVWKKIIDYPNYEVSNFGRVKRSKCVIYHKNGMRCNYSEKMLKLESCKSKSNKIYKRVTLCKNGTTKRQLVHRLVSIYFIENTFNKPCVNHLDGNPSNNHFSNLEWCTYKENERHSYDVLGKVNNRRKLSESEVKYIRGNYIKGVGSKKGNLQYLSDKFRVHIDTIYNIINNKLYVNS